jgi:hypothetical protein
MVNSYRYAFAATTPDLPTSGTTVDLGIGQIGIFDAKTWVATATPTSKSIVIAQGTPDTKWIPGVAKGNQTYKSLTIKGSKVTGWKAVKAQKPQGQIYTMGFDGVDVTKTLNVPVGKNFTFWITLSGQPIANLLGDTPSTHYATWTEQFSVVLPCAEACSDTCGDTYDCNVVADAVITAVNDRKIIGGQYLTEYVKFTKLLSCDTPSGLPTVAYSKWNLTVADTGDTIALAHVQAQYPGKVVKRVGRDGVFSTYEFEEVGISQPTDFDNAVTPVIPNCSDCPSGYTLVPAADAWIVSRPVILGATAPATLLATIVAAYGAGSGVFLSYENSIFTVELFFTTGTAVTALDADSVAQIGTNQPLCTQDVATTVAWTKVADCTKAKKDYVLTIKNDDCTGTYLTALQAEYAGIGTVTLVSTNELTCTSQYNISITSDNTACDLCDEEFYKFSTPHPFNGLVWTQVLGETGYGTGCVCGIKAESIYEQRKAKECFLKQVAYEFEPLFISFSTRNPDPNDYSVLCETDVPVTKVQNVVYPIGYGRVVADAVIASNYNFNQPWRKNPAERDAFEYELGIDLNGYYDTYILSYEVEPSESSAISGFGTSRVEAFEHAFYFPAGTGSDFETAINGFLAANNSDVDLVSI